MGNHRAVQRCNNTKLVAILSQLNQISYNNELNPLLWALTVNGTDGTPPVFRQVTNAHFYVRGRKY